jgi:hypothetical protein
MAVTAEGDRQRSERPISLPQNSGTEAPEGRPTAPAGPSIVCPGCGGINPADAVFCGNPARHKALRAEKADCQICPLNIIISM